MSHVFKFDSQTHRFLLSSASILVVTYAALRLFSSMSSKSKAKKSKGKGYKGGPEEVGRAVDAKEGSDPEYDVVIVGGGTSGCVLASRLTEVPNISVLLLEAGGSGTAKLESVLPGGYNRLFQSEHDYGLHTVAQANAGGRKSYWPRAKLLGGCSSMNAMMFHYGAPTDYDEWASLQGAGAEGAGEWAYSNFRKYFLKFEKFVPSKLYPDVDVSHRGTDGPVQVGYHGHLSNFCARFIESTEKVGVPRAADVNTSKGSLGVTKIMTYIDPSGRRVSTEAAYLTPDVLARPNLTVATHSQATKVLFETNADTGQKKAVGVEFARNKEGKRYRVKARKEVVLSAGAVHTPQILMLSGIGPVAHLATHSIPLVADLPGVGQHLMDHPVVYVRFALRSGESLSYLKGGGMINTFRMLAALTKWRLTGTGPLTTNVAEAAAFLHSSDPKLFPSAEFTEKIEDTASGAGAPDIELISSPLGWEASGFGYVPNVELGSLGAVLLRPTSTGSIALKSTNPFDNPIIDPNYLSTPHDVAVLVRGVKLCLRIASTAPISDVISPKGASDNFLDHSRHTADDAALEELVRKRADTLYHPTSTARMAPLEKGGVVDTRLRVYGVKGLRVVDASIFPTIMAGHTAGPSIAVAEKTADMMKEQLFV